MELFARAAGFFFILKLSIDKETYSSKGATP